MSENPAPYYPSPGRPAGRGHVTHGGMIDPELIKAAGIVPASRDADGNVRRHPEELEVTPVDQRTFDLVTTGDEFVDGTCVRCGLGHAVFVCAGRFVSLCPSCVVRRIEWLRGQNGPGEPAWIRILDRQASKEAAYQAWKKEELYTVVFDDVWKCGRCGALIQPRDARYYHRRGEVDSPPYCSACADALRAELGPSA